MPTAINTGEMAVLQGRCASSMAPGLVGVYPDRCSADVAACRWRYRLSPQLESRRPDGFAGHCFDTLVAARADALGARRWPGMISNLKAMRSPMASGLAVLHAWAFTAFVPRFAGESASCQEPWVDLVQWLEDPEAFAEAALQVCSAYAETWQRQLPWISDTPPGVVEDRLGAAEDTSDDGENARGDGQASEFGVTGMPLAPLPTVLAQDYPVFCRDFDHMVLPHQLASALSLGDWRRELDAAFLPHRHLIARLARRLQCLMLDRQRRRWSFDQDEGWLDPSRLARLVASPGHDQVFRIEQDSRFRQTAVTLLLDNSGSLRGDPVRLVALTADILVPCLERCGIAVEVLGFTTLPAAGNPVLRRWQSAGRPAEPGRLNALRHIVYKAMDTPWRRARQGLGLLLKPDLLQENIDGEALWWAAQRLAKRHEPRRLLVVISDGAPMDRATQEANPRLYLGAHLQRVVKVLEEDSDLSLLAIGIGHDVSRYYRNAIRLNDAADLGASLAQALAYWLD